MVELGQMLKEARLAKGLTIDDLQEATKIRKRYLEAIEEGNFKDLPGNFYVRAFIKSYAEAVGLDPNEVLGLYRNVLPAGTPEPAAEPLRRSRKKATSVSVPKGGTWITGVLLWSFLILILGILYYVISQNYQGDGNTGTPINSDKHITDKTPGPTLALSPSPTVSATPSATPTPTPTPTPAAEVKLMGLKNSINHYAVTGSNKMTIQLTIPGDECWVSLYKLNGKERITLENRKLVNGDTRTWESEQPVYLSLGKANAAQLTVNGTVIPVGEQPNPKKFQFQFAAAPGAASPAGAAAGSSAGANQ